MDAEQRIQRTPSTITWSSPLEKYFKECGEQSECLSVCHKNAEAIYSHRRTFVDIPVIILSSLGGFLQIGSEQMFHGASGATIGLGLVSLFIGILSTIGSYFGWSKRAEGHRIASIQYEKLYRFLSVELALPRNERIGATDLLKISKESIDRLQEISPMLPNETIFWFKRRYGQLKGISKPPQLNGLEAVQVFSPLTGGSLTIRIPNDDLPQQKSSSVEATS